MLIKVRAKNLRETRPREVIARFVFGGLMTVIAGLLARRFGPSFGGLFLAFPAIFPASASLVEKHERKRKQERGLNGTRRGADAAAADAAGAAVGCAGLIAFAALLARKFPSGQPIVLLPAALVAWAIVNGFIWFFMEKTHANSKTYFFRFP